MFDQSDEAAKFHALHHRPKLLILPNAWDAVSARIIEDAGAEAIATSSAAVAWAHGHADGHDLPIARLVQTVSDIVRVVRVPVSADAEGGYDDDPAKVGENIAALIGAGAVGINIEDGVGAVDLFCRKIEAARKAATQAGVDLYINARTDVYLKKLVPPEQAVEEAIRRARLAREAGASGLFAPLAVTAADIKAIAGAIQMPLNVIAWTGMPSAAELAALGAQRLSAGTAVAAVALAATRAAAAAFLQDGDSTALKAAGGPAVNYNALVKRQG